MRIVCSSDTHGRHRDTDIPDGDLFIHAGDFTLSGDLDQVEQFGEFLAGLTHRHKVVVAGNHDFPCQRDLDVARKLLGDVTYLEDSGAEIEGLSVWGSPWQPWFGGWAFNLEPGPPLAEKWALAPGSVDLLVTHTPPRGILDVTSGGESVGCEALTEALTRIRPRLHVFGHIHDSRGVHEGRDTLSVNAACCGRRYQPVHPALVVDWEGGEVRVLST